MSTSCPWCKGTGVVQDGPNCWQVTRRWQYVYIIYNNADECIYVGYTCYPGQYGTRWKNHRSTNRAMVAEAVRARVIGPLTFEGASRVEIEQQLLLRPKYNRIRFTRPVRAAAERLGIELDLAATQTGGCR